MVQLATLSASTPADVQLPCSPGLPHTVGRMPYGSYSVNLRCERQGGKWVGSAKRGQLPLQGLAMGTPRVRDCRHLAVEEHPTASLALISASRSQALLLAMEGFSTPRLHLHNACLFEVAFTQTLHEQCRPDQANLSGSTTPESRETASAPLQCASHHACIAPSAATAAASCTRLHGCRQGGASEYCHARHAVAAACGAAACVPLP